MGLSTADSNVFLLLSFPRIRKYKYLTGMGSLYLLALQARLSCLPAGRVRRTGAVDILMLLWLAQLI